MSGSNEDRAAEVAHDVWSCWMRYMFGFSTDNPDGSFKITAYQVDKWRRQMNTPFDQLTEKEQRSDYDVVKRYLAVLK